MLVLDLLLFGLNGYAQTKPKLPQKPLPHSKMTRAASYDYVPSGYEQVGTTDLCYQQKGSSIDVKGYFNGSWYSSTYSDGGYKAAISVTKKAEDHGEETISGSYTVNSWRGNQKYWYNGEYLDEYYTGDDYYNATLIETEGNIVTLTNFATFGGSITGVIDKENHTITFPVQTLHMDNWGRDALFCKQTDEFIANPSIETASGEVVATYDDSFNITMNGWCTLISFDYERYVFSDNTVSMSKNTASSDGTYTTSCNNGEIYNGVLFSSYVEQQGELARMCYSLTNRNSVDVTISLGAYADVMIGSNDRAPISRRKDQLENTYGLTMKDGYGAQLCVLFGAGLAGVSKVDDFWFGNYGYNNNAYNIVGNYERSDNFMIENGSYDSAMGWCWKNRTIPAGATVVFSYLIGVGDVRLEPNSSFEVTPDDPDGWNDLSRPHKLTLSGEYESPAGIDGMIEYAVEDSEEWKALTDTLASGEEFTAELIAMFNPEKDTHTIRFRTVDAVGNTTMLTPIIYKDVCFHEVAGIENKVYNYGDSIYQTNLTCDLAEGQYVVSEYHNNVNAGTATFMVQGVFPLTIGRRTYSFEISPLALEGGIVLPEDNFVYNGYSKRPEWQFTSDRNNNLVEDADYTVAYKNNLYPGEGTIEVTGIRNYKGTLSASFNIDKAQFSSNLYEFTLPNNDISYDGETHAATVAKVEGVGDVVITYVNTEDNAVSTDAPSSVGSYDIYAEFADGTLYYGKANEKIGSFSIYQFDDNEWLALNVLSTQLQENGWSPSWNLAAGPVAVSKFDGLVIEQGHVVGVNFKSKNLTGIPTGLLAFSQLKSVDLSHNNLTGNAGLLAAQLPNLTSLNFSYNQFSDLYPMISPNVTSLDISHQTIDKTIDFDIAHLNIEQLAAQIPTIVLYDHANQRYNTDLNFICTTSEAESFNYNNTDQWALQLSYKNGLLTMPYVSSQNTFYGHSGDTLKVFALDKNSNLTGTNFHLRFFFEQGDANFNGSIDILDVQSVINYMFEEYQNRPFNFTAANLWEDETINIQDAICGVNLLLEQSPASAPARTRVNMPLVETDPDAILQIIDGKLVLNSTTPVAAFDIVLNGVSAFELNNELNALGIMVSQKQNGNSVHFIGYSFNGGTIPTGEFALATVGDVYGITAKLADCNADEIKWLQSQTTAICAISADMLNGCEIYTLDGQKLNRQNIRQGNVYIVRSKGRSTKVMITK